MFFQKNPEKAKIKLTSDKVNFTFCKMQNTSSQSKKVYAENQGLPQPRNCNAENTQKTADIGWTKLFTGP